MSSTLRGFPGFPAGATRFTRIPNSFFSDLLPIVDDLPELKVIVYTFWRLDQGEGDVRYLRLNDVLTDLLFLEGMGTTPEAWEEATRSAFTRAAHRGVLLEATVKRGQTEETWYFLNSVKGRQAIERLRQGDFDGLVHDIDDVVVGLEKERPTVFLLYEQNIGMVTPMLAEKLRLAERDYPESWLHDAFSLAVERNKRSWAYIERILKNWAEHGKDTPAQTGRALAPGAAAADSEDDSPDWRIIH